MALPERPHGASQVRELFGDPLPFVERKDQWEQQILVMRALPRSLIYAYGTSQRITRVRAHRSIVDHLAETLDTCLSRGVPVHRMKYGGCYVWRGKRTASGELSLHTWGIAVDLEPAENPLDEAWVDDGIRLDPRIVEVFKERGWFWGNDFNGTKDPQHFQWATGV